MNFRIGEIYEQNPGIGRVKLARLAGCSEKTARTFLDRVRKSNAKPVTPKRETLIWKIAENLTDDEIKVILRSMSGNSPSSAHHREWHHDSFKFAVIADTHIGHNKFDQQRMFRAYDLIDHEGCDWIYHAGDILEGMSGRPGHIYELQHIGYQAQHSAAVDVLNEAPVEIRGIDGNHDGWYNGKGDMGVVVGENLDATIPNYTNLGAFEADEVIGGVRIKLWHGLDGSSYATSYRTQKFVEGLTGGEKPHVLLSGHAHKAVYHECRNTQVFECGTMCGQTGWMRGKKLAAHMGFWIIEIWPDGNNGLERIRQEWIPFYE